MTREDGIIDTIATVAGLLATTEWYSSEEAVWEAVDIYKRSREAVKQLQAEGNYGPIAGAKETKP